MSVINQQEKNLRPTSLIEVKADTVDELLATTRHVKSDAIN